MNRLRKPALTHVLLGMAAAWGFTLGAAGPAHAQIWSEYAMVSATMGVSDGRICIGEASRGDIGCPSFAPYVAPNGYLGIGTTAPSMTLTVSGSSAFTNGLYINYARPFVRFEGVSVTSLVMRNSGNIALSTNALAIGNGGTALGFEPQAALDVSGTIRMANSGEPCDTNRTGAIKYQSGDFYYCRNGTAWESLTSLSGGGGTAGDRITSGTTGVYTYTNASATIATAGVERVVIGANGNVGIGQQPAANIALSVSGSGINLTNPSTDPSLTTIVSLMAAGNIGAGFSAFSTTYDAPWADPATVELAAYSNAKALQFRTSRSAYAAPFIFKMGSTGTYPAMEVARITSTGLALGVITPTTKLEVAGRISTTTVQLANNPADACTAASIGAIKSINGRIYVCRQ